MRSLRTQFEGVAIVFCRSREAPSFHVVNFIGGASGRFPKDGIIEGSEDCLEGRGREETNIEGSEASATELS